ncbi:GNAT family N-acetyltransferase [Mucilaginibacter angelicae]|uniref:GNAT family N-acetyltransferase n=1 Tax=Mucilaginibacter angelicae TaxID=869718 RepID=A0ABV6LCZ6_9SPHI
MEKLITYRIAESRDDFKISKDLIVEYLETLHIDLAYMNLPSEFSTMEQKYVEPEGAFILALNEEDKAVGCVGLRKSGSEIAELKRLYVKDSYRGYKIGVTLVQKASEKARILGYEKIRLDVIPTLLKAKELYYSLGFYEIQPYFKSPVEGTAYMEKKLKEE